MVNNLPQPRKRERRERETTLVVYASLSTFADCEERERKRERERNELINSGERAAAAAFLFPSPPPFCVTVREGGGEFPISGEGALLSLQLIAISPRNSFQRKVEGEGGKSSEPRKGVQFSLFLHRNEGIAHEMVAKQIRFYRIRR